MNEMGDNMRPSGSTPPLPSAQPAQPSSSSASLYAPGLPSSNDPHLHYHPHHQYGAFSSGFSGQMAAAVACSSSGYPTFFPSKLSRRANRIAARNGNVYTPKKSRRPNRHITQFLSFRLDSTRGYDGLSPFSTPYNRSCPNYSTGIPTNLSSGTATHSSHHGRIIDASVV